MASGATVAQTPRGRKRHLLVDTLGLVLRAKIYAANIQDRAAVPQVLDEVTETFRRLAHVWLDQGMRRVTERAAQGHWRRYSHSSR